MGSVYVKHYADKIVIENPGGFMDGITEKNIITHPSKPRNKLIAETLQRLRYVQRTGQGVDIIFREMIAMGKPYPRYFSYSDAVTLTIDSATNDVSFVKFIVQEQERQLKTFPLPELMILRYLFDNLSIGLPEVQDITQSYVDDAKLFCKNLIGMGLIEQSGKEYILTTHANRAIATESDDMSFEKMRDTFNKVLSEAEKKKLESILIYLRDNDSLDNAKGRELTGKSAATVKRYLKRLCEIGILEHHGVTSNKVYKRKLDYLK
jgi:ATP-dependent DNA helicase RecG